jgi:competence protein ComEA
VPVEAVDRARAGDRERAEAWDWARADVRDRVREVAGDQVREVPADRVRADADALVARLRARRSASGVAAAYAAAHGHPTDPRAEQGARRWALSGTTAVVAVVTVLLLGLGVAAFSLRGDDVVPLAPRAEGADAGATPPDGASAAEGRGGDDTSATGADPGTVPGMDSGPGADLAAGSGVGADAGAGGSAGVGPDGAAGAGTGGGLLVHVVGAVEKPGLVTVPDGARVADALQAAGGATGRADLTAVNLARTVVDGEQLYVPRPGEPAPVSAPGPAGTPGTPGGAAGAAGTVDINTADAAGLEALPGVGPSIAQAIVEWREANGPFASVDELEDVPGIGPATLDEIRDSARVGP